MKENKKPVFSDAEIAPLYGLILAGGQSKRMGQDKGLLNYHGLPQQEYIAQLLNQFCEIVLVSSNSEKGNTVGGNFPIIQDHYHGIGPMGGLLTAMRSNNNVAWLVVACDMPFLNSETLTFLLQHRDHLRKATAFYNKSKGFYEPLFAIYEPGIHPEMIQYFGQGNTSLQKILAATDVNAIEVPNQSILQNINTPEEFRQALCQLQNSL